jgi:hypothetical protein
MQYLLKSSLLDRCILKTLSIYAYGAYERSESECEILTVGELKNVSCYSLDENLQLENVLASLKRSFIFFLHLGERFSVLNVNNFSVMDDLHICM